jgi:DNA-binding CsgD family transcriptional regulator
VSRQAGVVHERLERICAAPLDARTLRLRLLPEIAAAVPFDAYAWVLTDPETAVGCAPLADVPFLGELPRAIRLRYLTAVNRWTGLTDSPVGLLTAATEGDLSRSLQWRELLCRYDVSDAASVVFADQYGCWAFLELWRTGGRTFDTTDADLLRDLAPGVTPALRRAVARTLAAAPHHGPRPPGPLVLLLSPDLEVVRQTPETGDALRRLVPRDDGGPPVPAGAYNVAAQLLAVESGVDDRPARACVHLGGGSWLTMRAARLGPEGSPDGDIAVTIEPCTPDDRAALFARAFGLSPREKELLDLVLEGRDTREVATRMFLSPHTVQDHLKSIFVKTGTASRRALVASARGS